MNIDLFNPIPTIEWIEHVIIVVSVTIPRILMVFTVLPFFSPQIFHRLVTNSIAISLSLMMLPITAYQIPQTLNINILLLILFKEAIIGFFIAYIVSVLFWTVESVGFLIDNQRGSTMAQVMDPISGDQTSPLGAMLLQVITVLFFTTGGFLVLVRGLMKSYIIWPIFSFFPPIGRGTADFYLDITDQLMAATVLYSAPVVIICFVIGYGMGLMNRFAPSLNVFVLSMPIKSAISLMIIVMYMHTLVDFLQDYVMQFDRFVEVLERAFEQ